MAKNMVQQGDILTLIAPGTTVSGAVVQVGQIVGVAQNDAASGAPVDVAVTGVWSLPKTSTDVITAGALLYWTGTVVSATASGNTPIGVATKAAGNPSATVPVRLHGAFSPDPA